MGDQIVSQPDHGEPLTFLQGEQTFATPRLQLFFDDITRLLNAASSSSGGTIVPADFDPSSVIYKESTGVSILPAVINNNEFLGRGATGEIQGLDFTESWAILGNGTTNITLNQTGGANDFTVQSNTSSRMFVVQGGNNRVSIGKAGAIGTDGTVHIINKTAGVVAAAADGSTLVLEDEFEGGMSILNGANSTGNLYFGAPSYGEKAGNLWFWHDTDTNLPRMGIDVREKTYLTVIDTQGSLFNPDQDTDIDFQINSLTAAPLFIVDSSANRIGICENSTLPTDGLLHITRGAGAGAVTANSQDNIIVIESDVWAGISFLNPETTQARLTFGNPFDGNSMGTLLVNHITTPYLGWFFDNFVQNPLRISRNEFTINESSTPNFDLRMESDGSDKILFIDGGGGGRVGISNVSFSPTDGLLHILEQSAGVVTADFRYAHIVCETNASAGITFLGGELDPSGIAWGSAVTGNTAGLWAYWPSIKTLYSTVLGVSIEELAMSLTATEIVLNNNGVGLGTDRDFRVETNLSDSALYITGGASTNFGISDASIAPTDGLLHITQGGLAGTVTASTAADVLVLESNAATMGMSFLSPNTSIQYTVYGDAAVNNEAWIQYSHTDDIWSVVMGSSVDAFSIIKGAGSVFNNAANSAYDLRAESVGSTHALFVDAGADRVSISNASVAGTDGLLHLIDGGLAGTITASTAADTLVIESNASLAGMTLFCATSGTNFIVFGDGNSQGPGGIKYAHGGNDMIFFSNSQDTFWIDTTGVVVNENATNYMDFRAESVNNDHKLFVDAGTNECQTAAGTAPTALANIGGTLHTDTAGVGTTAVTTEETLLSYTLPANSLAVTDRGVRIRAWGSVANNVNTKQIKLKFGTHLLYDSTAVAAENQEWYLEFEVFRTGAATQDAERHFSLGIAAGAAPGTTLIPTFQNPTETLTGAVVIALTGQNGTASANDIVAEGLSVEYI